jgi:hypothetical protein
MNATQQYMCTACLEPHASRQELERHRRDAHFAAADAGPTGTLASGQSGTTPPTGTGGVATP